MLYVIYTHISYMYQKPIELLKTPYTLQNPNTINTFNTLNPLITLKTMHTQYTHIYTYCKVRVYMCDICILCSQNLKPYLYIYIYICIIYILYILYTST